MNFHIITSSYPATPQDPSGTAGLFVRQFALELVAAGHTVIVQPVARKPYYQSEYGITLVPTPWIGGDRELASMSFFNPLNWLAFFFLFISGIRNTLRINQEHSIDRVLCMWAAPSGIFGLAGKIRAGIPYDVWALGSDIWRIRKIPFLGKRLLKSIMKGADRVYADGLKLCQDVTELTAVKCEFLATSRRLPVPQEKVRIPQIEPGEKHFLFVGRYHANKGPDLLLDAISLLSDDLREGLRVHMFGLGPLESELRARIDELQLARYVDFNGPIQEQKLANYLASVSFLVIPSRIESIPLVFSDALQRGTPVVAMPVGDLANLVSEYQCGFVAESITAEALALAISQAATADKSCFKEATARAYARFDIGQSAEEWLDVTSELAETVI